MEVAADKKSGCAVVQEQTLPSRLHTKIPENYTGLPNKGQCSKEGFTSNMETCKKEMDLLLCEAVDTLLKKRPSVLSQHCQNMTRIRPHNFWTTLSMLADRSSSLQVSNAQLVAPVFHNQCYFVTLTEQLQALILLLDLLARDSKMLDVHKTSIHQYYLTSFIKLLAHVFRKYTHLLRTANLKELLDCFLPVAERSIEEMGTLGFDISPFSESYMEDTSLVPTLRSHIASLQQHEKANALKTKIAPKCDQQPLKTGCVVSHVKPRINASGRIVKTGIVSKSSQRKRESTSRPELFSWSLCALAPKLPRPEVLINSNDDHCTSNNADVGDKCLISNNTNNNAEQGSVAKTTQASQSLQHGPTSAHTVLKCQHLPEIKDSTIAATKMFLGFKRPLVVHDPNTRAKVEPRQQKQLKQLTLSNWKLS